MADNKPPEIAIIGGGITGVILTLGLLRRKIKPVVYERARAFREIGAGIGFTPNAERAMQALDPRILQCFRAVATRNNDDWFRYVDGFGCDRSGRPTVQGCEELVCKMYLGERGFEACRRSDFHQRIVDLIPEDCVKFGKNLVSVEDDPERDQVLMKFEDGSVEQADVGKSKLIYTTDTITNRFTYLLTSLERSNRLRRH